MTHRAVRTAIVIAVVLSAARTALAVTHLRRGDKPPDVVLADLSGTEFSLSKHTGEPVVLLFGELYHEKSLEACRTIQSVLTDARIGETHPTCVLIAAQQAEPSALAELARHQSISIPIL